MKYDNLIKISLVVVMGVVLLGLGIHFYGNGVADLNREATRAFEEALKRELATKNVIVDSLRMLRQSDVMPIGQAPTTVYILWETGREEYQVSAEKHQRNVVEDAGVRMLHSLALRKSPIVPDSLNVIWRETLKELSLEGETGLCVATTNGTGYITSLMTAGYHSFASAPRLLSCTMGYGCEIEVIGFVDYPFGFVFGRYVLIGVLCFSLLFAVIYLSVVYLIRIIHRPPIIETKIEVKEVVITHTQLVRDLPKGEVRLYKLTERTVFDAGKQLLIMDEQKSKKMRPQGCMLLEMLLNAEDYKLSDDTIMEQLWPNDHSATSVRLQQVISRLRTDLGEDSSIHLQRVPLSNYQLSFADTTPTPDMGLTLADIG